MTAASRPARSAPRTVTWFELCAKYYWAVFGREPPVQFTRENLKRSVRRRGLI
jgi:hypothetical protein